MRELNIFFKKRKKIFLYDILKTLKIKDTKIYKNVLINDIKNLNEANNNINKKKLDYTKKVLNVLDAIISKYVDDNSINIVFPKKNIVIAKKNLDITNSIMDLLNKQLVKIDF